MYDQSLEAIPRRTVLNDKMTASNTVRVLRHSPDGVTVQFRRNKEYTQVFLSFPQARLLADYLQQACESN